MLLRSFLFCLLAMLSLLLLACPYQQEMPPAPPLEQLKAGEECTVEFPPDGGWHSSGYTVRVGDSLRFDPLDAARDLGPGSLLVRIGRTPPQMIVADRVLIVSHPGEISMGFSAVHFDQAPDEILQVKIHNLPREEKPSPQDAKPE